MGIYVKYMEMPEGCVTCYLKHDCCDFKQQISSGNIIKYIDKRLDTCPLIEVTEPHGRLIDEAEVRVIMHQVCARSIRTYAATEFAIRNMKAVIEAEGE